MTKLIQDIKTILSIENKHPGITRQEQFEAQRIIDLRPQIMEVKYGNGLKENIDLTTTSQKPTN